MDDYSVSSLSESKNEWCARLVNTLTPAIIAGLKSIFEEAWNMCLENDEEDKYLMMFQTFLSRIPKWNDQIISDERKRIEETTSCGYLEELITCVHVIQLKALTCVRVGHKQKKVDIDVPNADQFVHRVYTNVARKMYTNVYLFEKNISPLEIQKHNRELEIIIQECVLNAVRDTMPVEQILRAYIDETEEQDVKEEIVEKIETVPIKPTEEEMNTIINEATEDKIIKSQETSSVADTSVADTSVADTSVADTNITDTSVADTSVTGTNTSVTGTDTSVTGTDTSVTGTDTSKSAQTINIDTTAATTLTPNTVPDTNENTIMKRDKLAFSDVDDAISVDGTESKIDAPKTDERLAQIEQLTAERREQERLEDQEGSLSIGDEIQLEIADVNDLNRPVTINAEPAIEVETLT